MQQNQAIKRNRSARIETATKFLVILFVCLMASWARAADGPLSADDVRLLLIGGKPSAQMVELIEQRGISFRLTPELESKLHDDGADDAVLKALKAAQDKPAPVKEATSASPAKREQAPSEAPANSNERSSAATTKDQPSNAGDSGDSDRPSAARERAESSATAGDEPRLIIRSHGDSTAHSQTNSSSSGSAPTTTSGPVLKTRNTEAATDTATAPEPKPAGVPLKDPPADQVQKIIQEFASKEKTFKEARNNYTYHQTNKVEELGSDGEVGGTYEQEWDILYDDNGKRIEHVTYAPQDTLKRLILTEEDLNAFRNINPFVLTSDEIPEYEIKYLGHVKVDEITAYVFEVRPKEIGKGKMYFQGQIWVDDRDLQIVKSQGKTVGLLRKTKQENLLPRFTTYREQIDGKYWFPTFTSADDTLYFSTGAVKMKEIIRYSDYKQFKSKSRILPATPTDQPVAKPK